MQGRKTKLKLSDSKGKILASPIYNKNSVLLMKEGMELTEDRIKILQRHGIGVVKVYV